MVQVIRRSPSFSEQLGSNLGAGLGQGIAALAAGIGQHQQEKKVTQYFKDLAEQNPDNPLFQELSIAYGAPFGMKEKTGLAKALLSERDPFRMGQQSRLEKDAILKRYNSRIKEINDELKFGTDYSQREGLEQLKHGLQLERDQLLGFHALHPAAEEERDYLSEFEDEEEPIKAESKRPKLMKVKPKFDPNNPLHVARRNKILKRTKGDRQKAGLVLSKEFEL